MIDSDLITELLTTYANLFQCETIVKFYNYEKIMESIYKNYKFICSKSLNSTICIMGLIKSVIKSNNFEFRDIFEDVKRFKNDTLFIRNAGDNKGEAGDKQDSEFPGHKKSDGQSKDGSPRAKDKNNKTQIINVKEANSSLDHAAKNLSEHKVDFIEKAPRGKNNENSEFFSIKKDDSITESFNIPQNYKNLTENKSTQGIADT